MIESIILYEFVICNYLILWIYSLSAMRFSYVTCLNYNIHGSVLQYTYISMGNKRSEFYCTDTISSRQGNSLLGARNVWFV